MHGDPIEAVRKPHTGPLFIPGIIVGLVYVFVPMRHLKYRLLRLLTGLAAVLLPVWEALVMRQLPTGW
jgi:hypothetical protein